jgi:hypothetical protein
MPSDYKPKRARVGNCPMQPRHVNTRIYRTVGSTRYCVCDDCGQTWKFSGPAADDLTQFALRLAESLDQTERVDTEEGKVIVMDDQTAQDVSTTLRRLTQ